MGRKVLIICIVVAANLYTPFAGFAIVLHPDGEPNLANWTDRPEQTVVGRWASNASCVAVSTNTIITARHQGGGIGTSIWFDGIEYTVEEVINEPEPDPADLRLCRVKRATPGSTYLKYVSIYILDDERDKAIVIGGYGKGRDGLVSNSIGLGYSWAGNNQTQRWGTNQIVKPGWLATKNVSSYSSQAIRSEFNPYNSTAYESAVAEYDSGGGWFIKSGEEWFLAAISAYVENGPVSYYSPAGNQWGIRISSYADWIIQTIPARIEGDYSGDYNVDFLDFAIFAMNWQKQDCLANNNCDGVDIEPDGDVDINDLKVFLDNWLEPAI